MSSDWWGIPSNTESKYRSTRLSPSWAESPAPASSSIPSQANQISTSQWAFISNQTQSTQNFDQALDVAASTAATFADLTADEKKAYDLEKKAYSILTQALSKDIYHQFVSFKTSKLLWDALKTIGLGNEASRKLRHDLLKKEFDGFTCMERESLGDLKIRFYHLLTELNSYGVVVTPKEVVIKFADALPAQWNGFLEILKYNGTLAATNINDFVQLLENKDQEEIRKAKRIPVQQNPDMYYGNCGSSSTSARPAPHAQLQTAFVSRDMYGNPLPVSKTQTTFVSSTDMYGNPQPEVSKQSYQYTGARDMYGNPLPVPQQACYGSTSSAGQPSNPNTVRLDTSNFSKVSVEVAKDHMELLNTLMSAYCGLIAGSDVQDGTACFAEVVKDLKHASGGESSASGGESSEDEDSSGYSRSSDEESSTSGDDHLDETSSVSVDADIDELLGEAAAGNHRRSILVDEAAYSSSSNHSAFMSNVGGSSNQKGKQRKKSHPTKKVNTMAVPLERLNMDLFGHVKHKSIRNDQYCLVVTDDYSRFSGVAFMAHKSDTFQIIKNLITKIENLYTLKVRRIRSDNRTKFKNHAMEEFCRSNGILHEFSASYTPQQNSVTERKNRTLIETARTMLVESQLPIPFWSEAMASACYTMNRVLTVKRHNKTCFELLHKRKPDLQYLELFGAPCTMIDPNGKFGIQPLVRPIIVNNPGPSSVNNNALDNEDFYDATELNESSEDDEFLDADQEVVHGTSEATPPVDAPITAEATASSSSRVQGIDLDGSFSPGVSEIPLERFKAGK
ncbi:uncharacterized protein LOC110887807 [Helianthus annuus]|uniref:uncharacterized protein LOC110887807 n=1 Tax=Helianthus annuus TaxID=4232 RepID=UPI000B8FA355|nr:uncharacterized protein LOC110887807 [Helianthus annuus]